MAVFVFTDAVVTINSVNLSDHVRQATLTYEAEIQDATAMGVGTRSRIAGLKNWNLEVAFNQDFAAGNVDATLYALIGAAPFPITVKPTSGAISATNPEYQGNAVLASYQPAAANMGEVAQTTARFESSGALTRDVTP